MLSRKFMYVYADKMLVKAVGTARSALGSLKGGSGSGDGIKAAMQSYTQVCTCICITGHCTCIGIIHVNYTPAAPPSSSSRPPTRPHLSSSPPPSPPSLSLFPLSLSQYWILPITRNANWWNRSFQSVLPRRLLFISLHHLPHPLSLVVAQKE